MVSRGWPKAGNDTPIYNKSTDAETWHQIVAFDFSFVVSSVVYNCSRNVNNLLTLSRECYFTSEYTFDLFFFFKWIITCVVVITAVAASAPRKSLGSSSTNSSPSSQCSTPGQFQPTSLHNAATCHAWLLYPTSQQRTSMLAATRCVLVQRQPGRKASATSLAVPQGSLRRKTWNPRRLRMMKRLEAVGCQRPAGSKLE